MAGNADGAGEPPQTRPEAEVPGRYRYFAFISYSRKDSRAAKWLQRRLEWFRFPVKLVAEERRPKAGRYLRPIYRDKTHLEVDPAHYWDNLKHAIDQSRYLIVLCTPDAAASEPVDREVVHFLKSREGTVENLVPVILKGRVGCGGEEECLGRTLRELGSQIQDRNLPSMVPDGEGAEVEGWENGFIGLAAYLLQLQRSALMDHVRREERRQKLRARILAGVMGVLAAGAILGGAMAFRYGIEAAAQRDEVTKQRNQQDELLWRASRADQEAAVTLPIGDRERVALMDRALSYQPRNAGALAASGVYAFGSAALRLNWITPVAHTGFCQAFSPDGRLLAVGDGLEGGPGGSGEGRATVFDAVTGRRLFQLSFKALVTSVGFSEDGGLVIAASVDQSIGVAETATGKERARWQFEDPVLSTLCSPDGRHVAMVNNEKVRVIEVSSGKVVREAAATGISNAKFSPDGRHLVVLKGDFASRPVATLEMATGKWRDVADGPALLSWIAFSPGSERLLLAKGTEIFAADSVGGPWAKWANLAGELDQLSFSPDGRYVAAEVQADLLRASMVVLDATTGKPMAEVDLGERLVAASFSPDGRWFAVAGKERIRVIELPTGKELGRIEPGAEINALLFNADGSGLLVDCRDQSLRMFEISGGKIGAIVPAKRGELFATCSPDGLSLAAGGGGGLVLKNLATGEVIAQAKISGLVMASDFSPDGGFLATGSKDGKACVMDAKSGRLIHELSVSGAVHGVAVSPDSRMIAMGTAGKEVMFFNAATGEKERSLRFETEVEAVCFSTDGRWLAAGGDETATVVNLKEDHEIRVCTFEGRIHSLGLSSDGQTLAAGLKDGTAHVVDLARGITK
ncbi:MAG TPA: PQQ-binding-like beta-propeller repeat protein [Prosthecobacter sp.]|nr:PQQ-binding-like beta-propeller repeat protein [Prosthecobacter sp.]